MGGLISRELSTDDKRSLSDDRALLLDERDDLIGCHGAGIATDVRHTLLQRRKISSRRL